MSNPTSKESIEALNSLEPLVESVRQNMINRGISGDVLLPARVLAMIVPEAWATFEAFSNIGDAEQMMQLNEAGEELVLELSETVLNGKLWKDL